MIVVPLTLADHYPDHLSQHAFRDQNRHCAAGCAVLAGRRLLDPLPAQLQSERRGLGGLIALAGLDAETGVVMLLYLDLAYEDWLKRGEMRNPTTCGTRFIMAR